MHSILPSNTIIYDRYVPSRSNISSLSLTHSLTSIQQSSNQSKYLSHILNNIPFNNQSLSNNYIPQQHQQQQTFHKQLRHKSHLDIPKSPQKILDAPNIRNDFYLNIIDWNQNDSRLAVALDSALFLYTPTQLIQLTNSKLGSHITSVKFHNYSSSILALAHSNPSIQIFDLYKLYPLRNLSVHNQRTCALDFINFQGNNSTMISGSKDKSIKITDLRLQDSVVIKYQNIHQGQICTVKSKNQFQPIFASGSNDNTVKIWDIRNQRKQIENLKGHQAAIKAIAWCPWKNGYLATGSGSADRQIRIWNTIQGKLVSNKQTKSQITGVQWISSNQSLVTSHGFPNNQINIWSIKDDKMHLKKQISLNGHRDRILSMIKSPGCQTICTASGDQTLRFWKVFSQKTKKMPNSLQNLDQTSKTKKLNRVL